MKAIRIRKVNDVNLTRLFSAHLCGGGRGYTDALALESYSNDIFPTVKTVIGFTFIVEVYEDD